MAGTLSGVAKNKGKVVASYELRTAGKPARVVLAADRNVLAPVWDDVVYVTATVVDENGVLVPGAGDLITFTTTGPGVVARLIAATTTATSPIRQANGAQYQGRVFRQCSKQPPISGRITIMASAPGLKSSSIMIDAVRFRNESNVGQRFSFVWQG